jgi:broad specificity phosphatase PhoE
VYLVRHGENTANLTKEFSYRKNDYSLTPKGILQAAQTAAFFRDKQIDEIYTSPLKRAQETAAIIGRAVAAPVTVVEEFREVNVGELEDLPPTPENWKRHNQVFIDWFEGRPESTFPGGENQIMLQARMLAGLAAILRGKTGRNIVIVGHGGIFTCTISAFCPDVDLAALVADHFHNCAISELELALDGEQVTGQLLHWGCHTHLYGAAADLVVPVLT